MAWPVIAFYERPDYFGPALRCVFRSIVITDSGGR
jgi:hypothetical protein